MSKTTENKSGDTADSPSKSLPFVVKAAALLLIVYGIIGLAYYLFTAIYSIANPHFLESLEFKNFKGNALFLPIIIELLVHGAIIISGFFIFSRKKAGLWFFYFSLFFSLFFFIVFARYFNYAEIIIGFLILVTLVGYRSRLH